MCWFKRIKFEDLLLVIGNKISSDFGGTKSQLGSIGLEKRNKCPLTPIVESNKVHLLMY